MPTQTTCTRCGYIASNDVCKACVLLEGLNRGLPKCAPATGHRGAAQDTDECAESRPGALAPPARLGVGKTRQLRKKYGDAPVQPELASDGAPA